MTRIFAGQKLHAGAPHTETIEVDETALKLFHTIVHPDGTVAHQMVRSLTPNHLAMYLAAIPRWQARGYYDVEYTEEQHWARPQLHAKHGVAIPLLLLAETGTHA